MNLTENKVGLHGRGWRDERKEENYIIELYFNFKNKLYFKITE